MSVQEKQKIRLGVLVNSWVTALDYTQGTVQDTISTAAILQGREEQRRETLLRVSIAAVRE